MVACPFLLVLALAKMCYQLDSNRWMARWVYHSTVFTGACIGKAIAALIPGLNPALAMICTMAALNAAVRTPCKYYLLLTKLTNVSPLTPILFASLIGFLSESALDWISTQVSARRRRTVNSTWFPLPVVLLANR